MSSTKRTPESTNDKTGKGQNPLLKVSKEHDVKSTAGFIAHSIRRNESPRILCAQPLAVNQAIKSLAIARSYLLRDGLYFTVYAKCVMDMDNNRYRVQLFLTPCSAEPKPTDSQTVLKTSASTEPGTIAGAIANKVRAGEQPIVSAIGAEAVFKAVLGLGIANPFLRDDKRKIDFVVEFKHISEDSNSISAIYFYVIPGLYTAPKKTTE